MQGQGQDPQRKIIDQFLTILLRSKQENRTDDFAGCRDHDNFMAAAGVGMKNVFADSGTYRRQPDQDFNNRKERSIIAHISKL